MKKCIFRYTKLIVLIVGCFVVRQAMGSPSHRERDDSGVLDSSIRHVVAFDWSGQSTGCLLWRVGVRLRGSINRAVRPFGLTYPQFLTLAAIGLLTRDGAITTQTAIAKFAGLDPNTTSQILRGLERRKLIKREQKIDERAKCPMLTKAGSQKLSRALQEVEKVNEAFFDVLSDKELGDLVKVLRGLL